MNRVELIKEFIKTKHINNMWADWFFCSIIKNFINNKSLDNLNYYNHYIIFQEEVGIFFTITYNNKIEDGAFRLILSQEGIDWYTINIKSIESNLLCAVET